MEKQSPSYFTQLVLCCVVHTTILFELYSMSMIVQQNLGLGSINTFSGN